MRAVVLSGAVVLSAIIADGRPASAEAALCIARINGRDAPLAFERDAGGLRSRLPRLLGGRGDKAPACSGDVVLSALLPELDEGQRRSFCIEYDKASDSAVGYNVGARDDEARCKAPRRTVCQRVNRTRDAAVAVASGAARRTYNGVSVVRDAPGGAVILSGTGNYIAQALGSIGGAAAGVAASPVVVAGAAVTVVAVGGTVYACSGTPAG